jgi:hypothetical protein
MLSPINSPVSATFAGESADDIEPAFGGHVLFEIALNSRDIDSPLFTIRDSAIGRTGHGDGAEDEDYIEVLEFVEPPTPAA